MDSYPFCRFLLGWVYRHHGGIGRLVGRLVILKDLRQLTAETAQRRVEAKR